MSIEQEARVLVRTLRSLAKEDEAAAKNEKDERRRGYKEGAADSFDLAASWLERILRSERERAEQVMQARYRDRVV